MVTPERWQHIESLFHAARERAPEDRAAWLSAACLGDEPLRREVESLLSQQGDLLDNGLPPAAARLVGLKAQGQHEGRTFGPYLLGSLLGAGGMGEVYRAHDSRLGRDVAVKVLSTSIHHDSARTTRFELEARVLASLNHPHVAAIYGLEECEGTRGIVMELVEGQTLAERLATGPLPLNAAVAIGVQIADALAAAHRKGIVHRDLKPANIKIAGGDIVKVLDFGLAKAVLEADLTVTGAATMTMEGTVVGTAPYMSPEQARGLEVDNRGDIWAFGCVLYEMLAGQRAFDGNSTVDVLAAVVHREPDFAKLPNATPRVIRMLLRRCLRKDPALRPGDIGGIRAQLVSIGGRQETKRQLALASIGGAVVVAAAVFLWVGVRNQFGGAELGNPSLVSRPDVATYAALRPVQMTASKGFDGFIEFAPDGRTVAYSSDRSGSMEVYVQGLASGSTPQQLTSNGRQNVQPSWSADGQFLAFCEMVNGGIWIIPSRGGTARKVSDFGSHARWSPDGRRIVFQSWPVTELQSLGVPEGLSRVWTVDVAGGKPPVRLTAAGTPEGSHRSPVWFRDSRRVIFAVGAGAGATTLWLVDGPDAPPRQIADSPKLSGLFTLEPDGRGIYFKARDGHSIWWFPLSENGQSAGEPQPTGLPLTGSAIQQLTMSPDGRHIGWTAVEQTANIWSVGLRRTTGKDTLRPLTDGSGVRYGVPAVAADGRLVMIGSRPGSASSLFLLEPRAALRQLTSNSPGGSPRWMPAEKEIAFISDRGEGPGFWAIDPVTGRERLLFPLSALSRPPGGGQANLSGAALSTAVSADFGRIAFAVVQNGIPNVWVQSLNQSGPAGKLVQRTFETQGGTYPSWSPDGRWLAYQCSEEADTQLCLTGAVEGDRIQLTRGPGQSWTGGWSPDGDQILIAARRDAVWNVASVSRTAGALRMLTRFSEPRFYVRYPRWDHANDRAVFERFEATGKIWSVELPARR